MDNRIRRNEICVIGLPRCDFVFSSTRSCFIAYGFLESVLEMTVLRNLLEARGIQAVEAVGMLAPGQNAYCAKICSKIITSQFCIVLLNNEVTPDGREIPNANVNMEYGLMLGFNKYVIPFQRAAQKLPFNVAGLDTIKYTDQDLERLAAAAIDQAITATKQETTSPVVPDQLLETFLMAKRALMARIDTEGDRNLFEIGRPLGYNLLHDFSGLNYIYLGNFAHLRPEIVRWRLAMLNEVLAGRIATIDIRVQKGLATEAEAGFARELLAKLRIWLILNTDEDQAVLLASVAGQPVAESLSVFTTADVIAELAQVAGGSA